MGASRKLGGLTFHERKYVREYVKHGNSTKAAEAGYPNQKKKHIQKQGAKVLARPQVKRAILEALEKQGVTDDYIAESLKKNIDSGVGVDANANTANRALEIAVKLKESVVNKSKSSLSMYLFADIKDANSEKILEKRAKLNKFFNNIIEGEEIPTAPPSVR